MKHKVIICILSFLLILGVYRIIFLPILISGGDYITLWPEHTWVIQQNAFRAWDPTLNLGSSAVDTLHASPYNFLMGFVGSILGNNIILTERLFWWIPFLILSIFSSIYLFRKLFPLNNFFLIAPFIFLFNTYVLMMIGGGQIAGIGLAYTISPLVLSQFIFVTDVFYQAKKIEHVVLFRKALIAGLLLAIQVMFDYRIAYITVIAALLYLFVTILFGNFRNIRNIILLIFYSAIIPFGLTGFLHAFWILPAVFVKNDVLQQLGSAYTSLQSVSFFSFAKFENTISLLHPNWPENIFGKVYFMRWEFLLIPLLAFSSLLFIKTNNKEKDVERLTVQHKILFFALLALVGSFLAKGTNDPFGGLYLWLFQHLPGFVMFRDSTKWYTLIAVSYAILIPFTISNLSQIFGELFKGKGQKSSFKNIIQKHSPTLLIALFIIFWFVTIRQAVLGQLGGTFMQSTIPIDYIQFKNFLSNDQQFSRVLWIPEKQRFGFWSDEHPAVWSYDLFHTASLSGTLAVMRNTDTQRFLQESSIKYIIVPSDSQKEIFLKDRKYDNRQYLNTIQSLDKISWLQKLSNFGNIAVYEVPDIKEHFWSTSNNLLVSYSNINPTQYEVSVKNAKKGDRVVFSESFARSWTATTGEIRIPSTRYDGRFNSFALTKDGDYTIEVEYTTQKWVDTGLVISLVTLLLTLGSIFLIKKKKLISL
jgi:hypothetical protein